MADTQDIVTGTVEVGVVVRELEPMMHFYGEVLGLEHVGQMQLPGMVMERYRLADTVIKLLAAKEPPALANPPGGLTGGASGLRYLTLRVDDVVGRVERCTAAGCEVPRPPFEYRPGVPVAIVCDPDGNQIELIRQRPG